MNNGKQLSNPYSTGGGGTHFENRVQASFVVLMLTGGYAPCLPSWPIMEIKLQGKYLEFDTDDLIIYVKQPEGERQAKLLGQIKHSIKVTQGDKVFGEVIQAAWNDFNNKKVFTEYIDSIALITGPLSATDTIHVRALLEQARHAKDAEDFIKRISLGKFTSNDQRRKLEVFKTHLKAANQNVDLTDEMLWRFLKSFHLLIYDLDIKGVTLSLIHSLIGLYSHHRGEELLALIVKEVTYKSENAGSITLETIPENILSAFKESIKKTIPEDLVKTPLLTKKTDWNKHEYASDLALANLLGSWNENYKTDSEIAAQLSREYFSEWIFKVREILQQPESPVSLKNTVWTVTRREELWKELGPRIFDDILEIFYECAVTVLTERDPKFVLSPDKRFAANVYGKNLKYSQSLRKGIAESLALLGSNSSALTNCSLNKPELIANLTVRKIFENSDWELWGSLNYLLPLLAEAAPKEFLNAVEVALYQSPCPFDELFKQEGRAINGENNLTGLLWALETLAWDEQFLVHVSVILGELAARDPGGNWANRPSNSLSTIFLPWFPQTTASIEKRKVAVQTLSREFPEVGWKLLLKLLPKQQRTSSGSHKPIWRKKIMEDWEKEVTQKEYWDQNFIYAGMAVEKAKSDFDKLTELARNLDHLPQPFLEKIIEHLSSQVITERSESERIDLWTELTNLISRHKRFSDEKWALDPKMVSKIEEVAILIAPLNPMNLHRVMFSNKGFDLFEEKGNWQEQEHQLEMRRKEAIKQILDYGGVEAVIDFSETVESPFNVGLFLGFIGEEEIDLVILPAFLNTDKKNLVRFTSGFVWGRHRSQGWVWVDNLIKNSWTSVQIGQFLTCLPFTDETWQRVDLLLSDSKAEYWSRANVNPYQTKSDLSIAIDTLIEHGRPNAAIDCLNKILHEKQLLDKNRTVQALLAVTETSQSNDAYKIVELIKALQNDPETNSDDLFKIEWAYLPLLDSSDVSPKVLENQLASNSGFFCEVIRLVYRSKKESEHKNEASENQRAVAENAYSLLDEWRILPGMQADRSFSEKGFRKWLDLTKEVCKESGHLEVALSHIGKVLFYSPPDPDGLWIHRTVAEVLNARDAEKMRIGFSQKVYSSRGMHWVDPTGKPERELVEKYKNQAEEVENAGYHRFAATLRGIADTYEHDAKIIITKHQQEDN